MIAAVKPQSTAGDVGPDDDLWENRYLDSFAVVNLVFNLEETFDITFDFPDVNAQNFRSVRTILRLLADRYGIAITESK